MKIDRGLIKTGIQTRAVGLVDKHQYIVLQWATGCGKTLAALRMTERIQFEIPGRKGLLVFKESTHRNNWIHEINKQGMNFLLKNIEMVLYASLHKVKREYYDYIILDECHALTWNRLDKLKKIMISITKLILLSATIPSDKKYLIEKLVDGSPVKYANISLKQAIDIKLLPEPIIYVHKIKMNGLESRKLKAIENKLNYFKRRNMFSLIKSTGLQRKNLIANAKSSKALLIIDKFKLEKKRFICFANDIAQADSIATQVIHSKNASRAYNENLIQSFNSRQIDSLTAVKMIREAINLYDIHSGLIIQLDKEPLAFYQMLGRCLRSENPEMHIIICIGTQDEVYFNNVMDKTLLKYVKYV